MALVAYSGIAKTFETSDGTTYAYVYVAANGSKPTFLLLHGFPATSFEWKRQIDYLTKAGFGVLAPDCLGYGDSDKPKDLAAYRMKRLSEHIIEILDHEGLDKVIGIGHDWGSAFLSRLAVYHQPRFSKIAFISVGYLAPGYPVFGYWYFYNSYDSGNLMTNNLESFHDLNFKEDDTEIPDLCPIGSARAWFMNKRTAPLSRWQTQEDKEMWLKIWSQGADGGLAWYRAVMRGVQAPDEDSLTDKDRKINIPVMFVGCNADRICLPSVGLNSTKPWAAAGFRDEYVDTGHWPQLQEPSQINEFLESFANE